MCFLYKGKSVDLRQIGREFNVRYVLEGSVQRVGARMRVNVELIEAESGAHLWAERFDKSIADLFEIAGLLLFTPRFSWSGSLVKLGFFAFVRFRQLPPQ